MSTFEVPVVRVDDIFDHPNADRLSIVKIKGFNCVTAKLENGSNRYSKGDLVIYVPEGALVPEYLLKMGFWDDAKGKGMLAGTKGNRVKAIKLRDVVSQGILFPLVYDGYDWLVDLTKDVKSVKEGDNLADHLSVEKWEPVIPASMAGEVYHLGMEHTVNFDVENIQKYPDLILPGEDVSVTEKLHGTFMQVGMNLGSNMPLESGAFGDQNFFIASKGLGAKGLVFKNNEKNRASNIYVRTFLHLEDDFEDAFAFLSVKGYTKAWILGEVFGQGVQDLGYGLSTPEFRVFDIFVEDAIGDRYFLSPSEVDVICRESGLERVPVLYSGPFDREKIEKLVSGQTTINGANIREGIVIRTTSYPRKMLKWVSEAYLLRKGQVTEFQ